MVMALWRCGKQPHGQVTIRIHDFHQPGNAGPVTLRQANEHPTALA